MPELREKYVAWDTECSGLDLNFGARPFFFTCCDEQENQIYWEFDVDPITRKVYYPPGELEEIFDTLQNQHGEGKKFVFHNATFDVKALATLPDWEYDWPWQDTEDTLYAAHLLASNKPHSLTQCAMIYLGVDVDKYDKALERCVKKCRNLVRRKYPEWRIAKKGLPEMPSAKETVWKFDSWLPRALATELGEPDDHEWYRVLAEYANMDSAITAQLRQVMTDLIREKGLEKIYGERLKLLPIVYEMERSGITIHKQRLQQLEEEYREESREAGAVCENIADSFGYVLELPKSGNNKGLLEFSFDVLKLPVAKRTEKGNPSLDRTALEHYEATLQEHTKELAFVRSLKGKRKRDTAINYMEGYRRYWLPLNGRDGYWYRLHSSFNPTGTSTLRWSSSNPNSENVSKQEGFNLRYPFGPAPGREWWAIDYDNLELRIPAYECGEPAMLELFEKPDEPPYFGSYHLLVFSILHPDKYDHDDPQGLEKAKKKYKSTWYQWTKNGNFADLYGAIESSGTADRAFHVPGAQRTVSQRLKEKSKLNQKYIDLANRYGYVETLPDITVDPTRGYPLYCSRREYGKISPTVPLNFHIQGTACWIVMMAMIRIKQYLGSVNRQYPGMDYKMIINVHDEIVFDFPAGDNDKSNRELVDEICSIMTRCGDDVGVPLTVGVDYISESWGEGVTV